MVLRVLLLTYSVHGGVPICKLLYAGGIQVLGSQPISTDRQDAGERKHSTEGPGMVVFRTDRLVVYRAALSIPLYISEKKDNECGHSSSFFPHIDPGRQPLSATQMLIKCSQHERFEYSRMAPNDPPPRTRPFFRAPDQASGERKLIFPCP